jgi:hypothetical protein
VTADVSTGGVRINMVPKDGGNIFSGQAFVGGTDGDWQADNVTDELRARGLRSGSRVAKIQDINFGVGGPIKRDKLWFFASWRRIATDSIIPGSYFASSGEVGTGVEDQWIQNQMLRLTWQVSSKNKFSIYHDRYPKFRTVIANAIADGFGRWQSGRPPHRQAVNLNAQQQAALKPAFHQLEYLYVEYQPGVQNSATRRVVQPRKSDLITLRAYDAAFRRPMVSTRRPRRPASFRRHRQPPSRPAPMDLR